MVSYLKPNGMPNDLVIIEPNVGAYSETLKQIYLDEDSPLASEKWLVNFIDQLKERDADYMTLPYRWVIEWVEAEKNTKSKKAKAPKIPANLVPAIRKAWLDTLPLTPEERKDVEAAYTNKEATTSEIDAAAYDSALLALLPKAQADKYDAAIKKHGDTNYSTKTAKAKASKDLHTEIEKAVKAAKKIKEIPFKPYKVFRKEYIIANPDFWPEGYTYYSAKAAK